MNKVITVRTVFCCCVLLLLLTACGASTPEEKVERYRGMYSARLNGFLVQQPEPAEPEMTAEEGVA